MFLLCVCMYSWVIEEDFFNCNCMYKLKKIKIFKYICKKWNIKLMVKNVE